jgi:glyoxylase-like metal-dependent hydrolase (beta-lactamase superfamily II)
MPKKERTYSVKRVVVGGLETNCWVLWRGPALGGTPATPLPAVVFDPGADAEEILRVLKSRNLTPALFLLTHCHGDHLGALGELKAAFPEAQIGVHEAERHWPEKPTLNLSIFVGKPISAPPPDALLRDGDAVASAERLGLPLKVIHVPGHSPGGAAFYLPPPQEASKAGASDEVREAAGAETPLLFCGDILFADGIGRGDLPGGEGVEVLARRIREKLMGLPEETEVLPGHGPRTTIGKEKRNNPYCGACGVAE